MPQASSPRSNASAPDAALVALAAPSGGFPYYAGRAPRLEPTAWALLALAADGRGPHDEVVAQSRAFLHRAQGPDGLLVESGVPLPNYAFNGLALTVLTDREDAAVVDRLASGLLRVRGIQVQSDSNAVRVNTQLQAWSWVEGTFSWVEPTAWCLLALKARRVESGVVAERIAAAEAVLFDRVCEPAGWNYGNAQVLTQDLRPYVPTTALALLALQDKRDHPGVSRSLDWLAAHALAERATLALSLAAIALHVCGRPTDQVRQALDDQVRRTGALANAHLLAMASYARRVRVHDARAMRVA